MNTIHNTKVGPKRQFVIVSNKHSGNWGGCMLFWGQLTANNEKRSFGGYTHGIDRCERYTLEEIREFSPHFAEYRDGMTMQEFLSHEDVIIKPIDLARLGLSTMQVWYRP